MGKNWDWSYQRGKVMRLEAEANAINYGTAVPNPPFHSHCPTMQRYFERGWLSVRHFDIHIYMKRVTTPTAPSQLEKLQEIKACHF